MSELYGIISRFKISLRYSVTRLTSFGSYRIGELIGDVHILPARLLEEVVLVSPSPPLPKVPHGTQRSPATTFHII